MKKLSIFFILIFLFLTTASAKAKKKYLALGDSITYGYTLDEPTKYAYPTLFSNKYDLDLTNEAIPGDTSAVLLEKLANYNIDDYDVISICIGANDVFKSFTTRIYGKDAVEMAETLSTILTDEEIQHEIEEGLNELKANLPKIMNIIKQGHAQIYMMNVYNPYNNSIIQGLEEIADTYVKKINEVIEENKSGTHFINLYKKFDKEKKVTNSQSLTNKFYDPHPTKKGQEVISSYLIEEYDRNNTTLTSYILIIVMGIFVIFLEIAEIIFTFKKFTFKNINNSVTKPKTEQKEEEEKKSSRFIRS